MIDGGMCVSLHTVRKCAICDPVVSDDMTSGLTYS